MMCINSLSSSWTAPKSIRWKFAIAKLCLFEPCYTFLGSSSNLPEFDRRVVLSGDSYDKRVLLGCSGLDLVPDGDIGLY